MNFVRRSAAIVLCAIISASIASDGVFNAAGCGPNYYGDLIRRPPIGRLMEFPWLARLGYRKSDDSVEYLFQGTLIHPYYVVTSVFAAGYNQNSLEFVRLGEYQTDTDKDCQDIDGYEKCAPHPQDIPIQQIIKHPQYNKPRLANDLVLLKLQNPANTTSEFVRTICVASGADFPLNDNAALFFSAWCGSVKAGISVVPMQYRMQLISPSSCAQKLSSDMDIDLNQSSQFCAVMDLDKKQKQKTKDLSLRGSTGAPLQMLGPDGRFYLVGTMSIGVRNARLETPYVFGHMVQMAEWLEQTVASEEGKRP
ncbi:phenoloxidase-activating enzyme 1-like [Ochlerotatus camptorhynchus]|uniref:phenoloxidase-activating enzyme 1-like n=1 Tax=Ochlerotatus camptorhynchus TaxID=644619 RepID=UPI0031E1C71F